MFPKLRLQHKANLVQLSGGMSSLPITKPEERAIPLKPDEWKARLTEAMSPAPDSAKIKVHLLVDFVSRDMSFCSQWCWM